MAGVVRDAILSILLALTCAAVPWLARAVRVWPLVTALVVGITVSLIGASLSLPLSPPWTDLVILLVALSGGLLLGRGMPPRFLPFLSLLLLLSVLDVTQTIVEGGLTPLNSGFSTTTVGSGPSGPLLYLNFILPLAGGRYLVGLFDLLLLTAVAEHWRRRGASYLIAFLPGVLGFLLGYGAVVLTHLGGWPLFPFFTAGWLVSDGVHRLLSQRAGSPSMQIPEQAV
jgi:hypothetical protein